MIAPVKYIPNYASSDAADWIYTELMKLDWEQRDDAPRMEYYCNDTDVPYTYGKGAGIRTYYPRPWHACIREVRTYLEINFGYVFDVCFLNRYDNSSNWLGWHSDDSPEMDPARPIVTASFGQERDIEFRNIADPTIKERLTLGHGSIAIMAPGMQETWQHRIPKCGFVAKPRISLTFRGYKE